MDNDNYHDPYDMDRYYDHADNYNWHDYGDYDVGAGASHGGYRHADEFSQRKSM